MEGGREGTRDYLQEVAVAMGTGPREDALPCRPGDSADGAEPGDRGAGARLPLPGLDRRGGGPMGGAARLPSIRGAGSCPGGKLPPEPVALSSVCTSACVSADGGPAVAEGDPGPLAFLSALLLRSASGPTASLAADSSS